MRRTVLAKMPAEGWLTLKNIRNRDCEHCSKKNVCKYKEKVDEEDIRVVYEDGSEDVINKSSIINIIQKDMNGRIGYIKYRD